MKIVLVQSYIIWENIDANIQKAESIINRHSSCDLLLFPEMSFTGFSMNTEIFVDKSDYILDQMKKLAKSNNVKIGFGFIRRSSYDQKKCENVYIIINENGLICSEYVKIHPFSFSNEDRFILGGNKMTVFMLGNISFSIFICYDLRFPEVFRAVADSVHGIIVSANWPAKRSEHWKTLLRARAIENQVYIFAVNCQGNIGGQYYSGDSCIVNPDGNVLDILSNKAGEICYTFTDDTDYYREIFPVLKDKKYPFTLGEHNKGVFGPVNKFL